MSASSPCHGSKSSRKSETRALRWVAAAAAIAVLAITTYFVQSKLLSGPQGMRARVESLNGVLSRVGYSGDQPLKVGDEVIGR